MFVEILKGLPASGKSTYAKEQVAASDGKTKRVNKDDLRAMLDNSKHSREREKYILEIRDSVICSAIRNGYNVIVDDTNLASKHVNHIR